jgi:N-acetylglucosaminyl-diphospho-decaprenol L-rhamnosyltransferase
LTPLEALASGIPPIVGDTPVAREVCGDAAQFVTPGDVPALADALTTLLLDGDARDRLLARAPAVLARYSWDRAADETLAAVEEAGTAQPVHGPTKVDGRMVPAPGPAAGALNAGARISDPGPRTPDLGSPSDLAIVIVSFNVRDELARCLASLAAHPPRRRIRIVVVDNASSDGTVEMMRADWPSVELVPLAENRGFAAANNIGIRATRGSNSPWVLLLNSDTEVPAGAIDRLVDRAEAFADVGVAGPRLVDADGRPELSFGAMPGPLAEARQKRLVAACARGAAWAVAEVQRRTSREQFPAWVSGACLLVRRADAVAAGLLDERYFMYLEDADFCAAVRALGRRVLFTPAASVLHLRGRSRAKAPAAVERGYRRSQLAFYRKHHPLWAPVLWIYLAVRGRRPR